MQAKKDPLKEGQWVEERGCDYYCYVIPKWGWGGFFQG